MALDVLLALGVIAALVASLVWTRRRWGEPRLYVRGRAALWLVAAILALIFLRITLD